MKSTTEESVARHYATDSIEKTILAALEGAGKDLDHLTVDDLASMDEFHIGGRDATADIGAAMQVAPGQRLLDVGSGIGGPARYFAAHFGAHVTGIDLTKEFVDAAVGLSKRLKLENAVEFRVGSALDLPFPDASFDGAYIFHVGMNISDKARLFGQVRRVLRPGGVFGVYDVMRTGGGELSYPVPWAMTAETSFVEAPERYRELLRGAGFGVISERDRRDFALEYFAARQERAASPVGLPILMGPSAPVKMANMVANLGKGLIAPVEMICCLTGR